MKKLALCVFFVNIAFSGFAQNKIFWIDMGLGWDNKFETAGSQQVKTSMNSFAVDLGRYNFKNDSNIGFFTHTTLTFPQTSTLTANGVKVKVDLASNYDFIMGLDGIAGVGFRSKLETDKIVLYGGIGPEFEILFATNEYARQVSYIFGVGGAIGVKFNITDVVGISIGNVMGYGFACYTLGSNAMVGDISGWAERYSLIKVRPYICLSLNGFWGPDNRQRFGKAIEP
jgi:hypothetical protein